MHLALNSGHDGWFPDVIRWSCADPGQHLMKTHASNGVSQMIPGPMHTFRISSRSVSVSLCALMACRTSRGFREFRRSLDLFKRLADARDLSFFFFFFFSFSFSRNTVHTFGRTRASRLIPARKLRSRYLVKPFR